MAKASGSEVVRPSAIIVSGVQMKAEVKPMLTRVAAMLPKPVSRWSRYCTTLGRPSPPSQGAQERAQE